MPARLGLLPHVLHQLILTHNGKLCHSALGVSCLPVRTWIYFNTAFPLVQFMSAPFAIKLVEVEPDPKS